jgi:apolipoprotein N-acyltransferase
VALLASGRDRQGAGRRRWRGDLALAAGCAAAWVALEWVFPKVFPWSLGDALVGASRLRQGADLGGVHGLSFVVVLAAAWFALGLDRRLSWREGAIRLAVGATLPLLLIGYATARSTADPAPAARPVRVAVVQGAIPVDDATREEAAARGWQIYQRMTWALLAGAAAAPQLVIWPETTLPVPLRDDAWYRALVEQLAQGMGRTLILGALDRSSAPAGEMNSAYAVSPAGADRPAALRAYHKSHLMPWAEYVPGGDWLPLLRGWRTTGDLVPGAAGESFAVPVDGGTLRIAPSICVEGLRPGWFNDLVRGGAGVLLNLTDDGWLAGSPGPDLHLQLARMRAVETRRWLVRASNSGVSAVIDPHGEVVAALPFGEPGTLVVPVSPATAVTPYVRFGDWPVGVSAVVLAWLLFPVARRRMGARIRVGRPRPAHRPSGGRAADRPVIDRGKQPGWHR